MGQQSFRRSLFSIIFVVMVLSGSSAFALFQGGGGGVFIGTGTPATVDAAEDLADYLNIDEEEGHFTVGGIGFYQGPFYRIGAVMQANVWGSWNIETDNNDDDSTHEDTAGVAALTGGFYGTLTISKGRFLFNVGSVIGAGQVSFGYDLGEERGDHNRHKSISTFYLEPLISFGLAPCSWFGLEFQLSTPIYIFGDELTLTVGEREFTLDNEDLIGVTFSAKLLFGRIADLYH